MRHLLSLLIIPLLNFGQVDEKTKNYISIGFLDHKTGTSMIGYSRSIIQNKNHELFIGFGTLIATNTLALGVKKYLLRSFIDSYSVISLQRVYGMGGEGFNAPAISIGFEKKIWKKCFINLGVNSTVRFYSEGMIEFINYPNININVRF